MLKMMICMDDDKMNDREKLPFGWYLRAFE